MKCDPNGFQSGQHTRSPLQRRLRFPTIKCGTMIDIGCLYFLLNNRLWDEQISNKKGTCLYRRSGGLAYRPIPLNDHRVYLSISQSLEFGINNIDLYSCPFVVFLSPYKAFTLQTILLSLRHLPADPRRLKPIPRTRCIRSLHVYSGCEGQ